METKGFFAALMDLSFTDFITTRVIKVLYVLGIIVSVIAGLGIIAGGLTSGSGWKGVVSLFLGPLATLIHVLVIRIWLELVIVVFRIEENTAKLSSQVQTSSSSETYEE
jgi:uncharacterized membrane protein